MSGLSKDMEHWIREAFERDKKMFQERFCMTCGKVLVCYSGKMSRNCWHPHGTIPVDQERDE